MSDATLIAVLKRHGFRHAKARELAERPDLAGLTAAIAEDVARNVRAVRRHAADPDELLIAMLRTAAAAVNSRRVSIVVTRRPGNIRRPVRA